MELPGQPRPSSPGQAWCSVPPCGWNERAELPTAPLSQLGSERNQTLPKSPHLSSLGYCLAPRVARLRFVTHGNGSAPKATLSSISQGEAWAGAASASTGRSSSQKCVTEQKGPSPWRVLLLGAFVLGFLGSGASPAQGGFSLQGGCYPLAGNPPIPSCHGIWRLGL